MRCIVIFLSNSLREGRLGSG